MRRRALLCVVAVAIVLLCLKARLTLADLTFSVFPFAVTVTDGASEGRLWFNHATTDGRQAMRAIERGRFRMARAHAGYRVEALDESSWTSSASKFVNASVDVARAIGLQKCTISVLISTRTVSRKACGTSVSLASCTFDPGAPHEANALRMQACIRRAKQRDGRAMSMCEIVAAGRRSAAIFNNWIRYARGKYWVVPECTKFRSSLPGWHLVELAECPEGWYVRKHISLPLLW